MDESAFNLLVQNLGHDKDVEPTTIDDTCPACDSRGAEELDESGIPTCTECGYVYSNAPLAEDAERKGCFDSKQTNRCTGRMYNDNLPSANLGQIVQRTRGMTYGIWKRMSQLATWNYMNPEDRTRFEVHRIINNRCEGSGIGSNVAYRACNIFNGIHRSVGVTRGEPRTAIIAACVYQACISMGVPRTRTEIANMFSISDTVFYKKVTDVSLAMDSQDSEIRPSLFAHRMTHAAGLSTSAKQLCYSSIQTMEDFLKKNNSAILSNTSCGTVVASCICLVEAHLGRAPNRARTENIAKACEVSVMSVKTFTPQIEPLYKNVLKRLNPVTHVDDTKATQSPSA